MRRERSRAGMALVEVLVAIVVLALSCVALLGLFGQIARSVRTTRDSRILVQSASTELDRLVVWDGVRLRASIGRTSIHGWTLDVAESSPGLFDVRIAESDSGNAVLRTVVYRPDTAHATP